MTESPNEEETAMEKDLKEMELKEMLIESGASLVGFADIASLPAAQTKGYPVAVAIAIALNPKIVSGIPTGPHIDYCYEYNDVNAKLDALGEAAEAWLNAKGFDSYAVTRARAPYAHEDCLTDLPYKTVAHLAGLGWIGKNALLVTREFGCAQRLTVVLTHAPLPVAGAAMGPICGSCSNCRRACPGEALKGITWSEDKTRDDLVDFHLCQKVLRERGPDLAVRSATCGMCIAACPFTKGYLDRALSV